ncbi:MAG: ABC transporter permease [Planctomycetota bacterium]|jgi:ABC-type lipoprotein release transport system permease subunit
MYKFILPTRYFLKKRITYLAVAAVALSVFIVVVVMTVMNGLVTEFKGKNHDFVGDCIVSTDSLVGFSYYADFAEELNNADFVEAFSTVVNGFGLLSQPGSDQNIGVQIMGVELDSFCRTTAFGRSLYYHKTDPGNAFTPSYKTESPGCVVGIDMISGRRDGSGGYYHDSDPQRIELIITCFPLTAKGALAKAATDLVNSSTVYYSDDSHTGLVKVDARMVYLDFEFAQKLFGMSGATPRASAIHIKFAEGVNLETGVDKIAKMWDVFVGSRENQRNANLLRNVTVQSWLNYRRSSIAPMEKEQTMLILLFAMLGIITVFIIFVVFYMIISHKTKDIGILRSIGVSRASVVQVFVSFAVLVGICGAGIGVAGGCAFLSKINNMEDWLYERFGWQLWDRTVYAIGDIPNNIEWEVLALITASAILAVLAGAYLPAARAAARRPVEVLHVGQL